MNTYEIPAFGIDHLQVVDREKPVPAPGQVLVRMTAASLNYRDLMVVRGHYNPKMKLPMTPLSDGVGIVEAIGEGVDRFVAGDRVAGIFMQEWIDGRVDKKKSASALGGAIPGVLREYMLFHQSGLVKPPAHLTDVEAATLPCAAVTAWHALFEEGPACPGDTVLLQGTGGVSLFALQFAKAAGFRVIITSSSDEKLQRARQLGADETINYKQTLDWDEAARHLTGGVGVDHVIEVGGADTLPRSLKAVRMAGTISVIGVLGGNAQALTPAPILMNTLRVQGIYVGSRAMFERMNRAFELHAIKPIVDQVFPWTEAKSAYQHLESQRHFGKICLAIT
jgi:NADPH:quinone reductase-like Zn-dependent oxidoreductase